MENFFSNMTRIIKCNKIFDGENFIVQNAVCIANNKVIDVLLITDDHENNYEGIEKYSGILVPGFVNAHCHLELSYLHNEFVSGGGMVEFLKQMLKKRKVEKNEIIYSSAHEWDKKMRDNGIVAVGDIVNTLDTLDIKKKSDIEYINFVEVFGLNRWRADKIFEASVKIFETFIANELCANIVPHSPYSLSERLWDDYLSFENKQRTNISSFHFMESKSEMELIQNGRSEISRYFIQDLALSVEDYQHIPEKFDFYLKRYLGKEEKIILVHNTYLNDEYFNSIAAFVDKIYFCFCPNANLFIENRLPNIEFIRKMSDKICIGTDSLASNHNLCIVDEINVLLKHFDMDLDEVLRWATSNGANALGVKDRYGYIQQGYSLPLNLIEMEGGLIKNFRVIK